MPNLTLVKPTEMPAEHDLTYVMACQKEFATLFEVPTNAATRNLYESLIDEEHEELKELVDLLYVTAGLAYHCGYDIKSTLTYSDITDPDIAVTELVGEVVSGKHSETILRQLMYVIFNIAAELGYDFIAAYRLVHMSNLTKLGNNGKPIRRADGKVTKGPNYVPPDLTQLIGKH